MTTQVLEFTRDEIRLICFSLNSVAIEMDRQGLLTSEEKEELDGLLKKILLGLVGTMEEVSVH